MSPPQRIAEIKNLHEILMKKLAFLFKINYTDQYGDENECIARS